MDTFTPSRRSWYLLLFFFLSACGNPTLNNSEDDLDSGEISEGLVAPTLIPPFQSLDVAFREFDVDNSDGDILKMSTGTVIRVPKNAFVDANGKLYEGKVKLKYREFHDAASIIAAGIPMVNRGDDAKYMQTAGMMEIRPANPDLQLAPGKEIEVEMASYVQGNEYDFFFLEEKNCQWIEKGTTEPRTNPVYEKLRKIREAVPVIPTKPARVDRSKFVFNLDINYQTFPELKSFKNVIWQYSGNTDSDNPEKNSWIFEEDWTSIDLKSLNPSKALYSLQLRRGDKKFETVVSPALTGQDYDAAIKLFQKKNQDYESAKRAFSQEKERVEQEAELLRSFRIDRFGIFNWDIWKMPKRIVCNAKFEFDGNIDPDINKISIFLVSDDERSVVKYTPASFNKFSFDPSGKNKLIAVLPGNRLAVFSSVEFSLLDMNSIEQKSANHEEVIFKLSVVPEVLTSIDDLKLIISRLG